MILALPRVGGGRFFQKVLHGAAARGVHQKFIRNDTPNVRG